jgi:hypothetical protein
MCDLIPDFAAGSRRPAVAHKPYAQERQNGPQEPRDEDEREGQVLAIEKKGETQGDVSGRIRMVRLWNALAGK